MIPKQPKLNPDSDSDSDSDSEDLLHKQLQSRLSEITDHHARVLTPEMQAEVYATCIDILRRYGVEDEVEITVDPSGSPGEPVKVNFKKLTDSV